MGIAKDFVDSIQYMINTAIEKAPFDKVRNARIVSINEDGTNDILLNGYTYTSVPKLGNDVFAVNSTVRVLIPENQMTNMVILGSTMLKPSDQVFTVNGKTGDVVLTKTDLGLGNVDNTSDANKPVSTLQKQYIDSMADKHYVYNQTSASTEWTITHNLGKYPSVTIVGNDGVQVMADYKYINANTLKITFNTPFLGKAYLN